VTEAAPSARGSARAARAATGTGTRRYRDRFAPRFAGDFYRPLPEPLCASSLGLGTYLGDCGDADDARYEEALRAALEGGCNLVDTAINYRCQRSERAVGRALAAAIADEVVRRDEVIVATKGGFVPLDGTTPPTREAYDAYLAREFYDAGVMTPGDVVRGGHCLAPRFLAHQVARSRENLGVGTIDLYYLHNPEQQLDALDRPTFHATMRRAFVAMEECVARHEIGRYGVATWKGLRVPPGVRGHVDVAELVALAREVAGDRHHFSVVQAPINLAMTEAVRTPTQRLAGGRLVPLLQAAAELGVQVVASASLMQAQLAAGLPPQVREAFPDHATDAQRAIAFVRSLPGVGAALVGMRGRAHVEENLGVRAEG
jgi:aryl-alcohol dehydrogenase-like predicted oxidoreductase